MKTIFAQASAQGRSGIAVFRLSGPLALNILVKLSNKNSFEPRRLYKVRLIDPLAAELIDESMVVYFQKPNSFTGEEVVEFFTHGSIAVAKMLLDTVLSFDGVRLAEPGEFTKKAILNGKMNLTAAEGLVDLISAETLIQHRQAIRQMGGALNELYSNIRIELLKVMSFLEAYIDFPDEEIPLNIIIEIEERKVNLINYMQSHLDDNRRGQRLREGIKMTIYGRPNVGKSTLINLLAQKEIAIVSNIAGTTRDTIETHLDIGGFPIILTDTAGLRESTIDVIEQEGIRRAYRAISEADIKIQVFDIEDLRTNYIKSESDKDTIKVLNKIDLLKEEINKEGLDGIILLSAKENVGIKELLFNIVEKAQQLAGLTDSPAITRERHRNAIHKSVNALKQCNLNGELVLAAEDLRIAIRYLDSLIGKIEIEEILGEIFSSFCIGK